MDRASSVLLMFDRPNEPIYVPKSDNRVAFDIPLDYLTESYQAESQRILNRFGNDSLSTVTIKKIALPDISPSMGLSRNDNFSIFLPAHQAMATHLINLFIGMRTIDDLLSLTAYCHDRVNTQMFVYALSIAIYHRPDTKHLTLPQLSEIFPEKFFNSSTLHQVREDAFVSPPGEVIAPIEIPLAYTATDADPEHRVAYWREDMGVNLHHWHWHLIYPSRGPTIAVKKDRRGELFYFMHHQLTSRYEIERICVGLPKVVPLSNLRKPLKEGYFPKLETAVAGRAYAARPPNFKLSDLNRPLDLVKISLSEIEKTFERIKLAISNRKVLKPNGGFIELDEKTGIDVLGNMLEASYISPNFEYYGDFHNSMHNLIAYCHDPDHRYLETFSILGDLSTSMRDPAFYRIHAFMDEIFSSYKQLLGPYPTEQLDFPGIAIKELSVETEGSASNTLRTHWNKSDVELSRGMDFIPRDRSVRVRVQHLNHEEFLYKLKVYNSNDYDVVGTARIYLAPRFDVDGAPLKFDEQRMLMIEMDKFTVKLEKGVNDITRSSKESSITIPFESTFRDLDHNRPSPDDFEERVAFDFCGCGWPQHMLVPKGTVQGFPMSMFVMISDYEIDKVLDETKTDCRTGVSFCGIRNQKYPDSRAMGYPFDRVAKPSVQTIEDFLLPNMGSENITVLFTDEVKPRKR